jgi:hypothetical protein
MAQSDPLQQDTEKSAQSPRDLKIDRQAARSRRTHAMRAVVAQRARRARRRRPGP